MKTITLTDEQAVMLDRILSEHRDCGPPEDGDKSDELCAMEESVRQQLHEPQPAKPNPQVARDAAIVPMLEKYFAHIDAAHWAHWAAADAVEQMRLIARMGLALIGGTRQIAQYDDPPFSAPADLLAELDRVSAAYGLAPDQRKKLRASAGPGLFVEFAREGMVLSVRVHDKQRFPDAGAFHIGEVTAGDGSGRNAVPTEPRRAEKYEMPPESALTIQYLDGVLRALREFSTGTTDGRVLRAEIGAVLAHIEKAGGD